MTRKPAYPGLLLPPVYRRIGFALLVPGTILLYVRHGMLVAPEWLNWPVFAVHSVFVKRRVFEMINNNVLDEWAGLLVLIGCAFCMFSREVDENGGTAQRRLGALIVAGWSHLAALTFILLFTYGLGFIQAVILVLPVLPVAYLVAYRMAGRNGSRSGRLPMTPDEAND